MKDIKKVYGPYENKGQNGRKYVVIHYVDGTTKSTQYARHLMEQHLGRELLKSEQVDHINDDFTDDRLSNLQVLTPKENRDKEAFAVRGYRDEWFTFICPICGNVGRKKLSYVTQETNRGKAGPFCSKSCAGSYSHIGDGRKAQEIRV